MYVCAMCMLCVCMCMDVLCVWWGHRTTEYITEDEKVVNEDENGVREREMGGYAGERSCRALGGVNPGRSRYMQVTYAHQWYVSYARMKGMTTRRSRKTHGKHVQFYSSLPFTAVIAGPTKKKHRLFATLIRPYRVYRFHEFNNAYSMNGTTGGLFFKGYRRFLWWIHYFEYWFS